MRWHVITRNGQRWFPYIVGGHEIVLHPEGADTDMADMEMGDLVDAFGTVAIRNAPKKEQ